MKAERHVEELKRLTALRSYDILDSARESDFDDVVQMVSEICDAPISVINLIDDGRQWFKAEVGLGVRETPLESSICAHAILQPGLSIVPDTTLDRRFIDNELVTGEPRLRFYAGALLETADGLPLGTVCVLDFKPRELDQKQKNFLRLMAKQVMKMLELRRTVRLENAARVDAERLLKENDTLMRESDHRVMNSLQLVQAVLTMQIRNAENEVTKRQLDAARTRVLAVATVHKQLHETGSVAEVGIDDFMRRLCESLNLTAPASITTVNVRADNVRLPSDLISGLGLVTAELVTNSFKYAYKEGQRGPVSVDFAQKPHGWELKVSDEGVGLPDGFNSEHSTGIGMRVVSALCSRLHGTLSFASTPGKTTFTVAGTNPTL